MDNNAQPSRRLCMSDVASLRTPVHETPLVDAFLIEMINFARRLMTYNGMNLGSTCSYKHDTCTCRREIGQAYAGVSVRAARSVLCLDHLEDEGWKTSQSFQEFCPAFGRVALEPRFEPGAPGQRITVQKFNGVNCLTLRYQGEARWTRLAREQFQSSTRSFICRWVLFVLTVTLFLSFLSFSIAFTYLGQHSLQLQMSESSA